LIFKFIRQWFSPSGKDIFPEGTVKEEIVIRIGINGFGRIGRQVLKAVMERHPQSLQVVAINDLFDSETNAHLFKYDTNYGKFAGEVKVTNDGLIINGLTVKSFSLRDPASIPWDREGVDIVVEGTGLFRTGPKAAAHLKGGAKKLSSPLRPQRRI
jgi:glyceraldehyde-3-phosphate dehydrogenase (EC 1.2.1.12)